MTWPVIIQTISLLIAAVSVAFGVTAWRRTELGKRRVELAEETLELFGKMRDALRTIRSPIGFAGEGTSRKRAENETPEESEILDRAYVVFERYKLHEDIFNKAYSIKFRAKAYFGEEVADCFEEMANIRNEVFSAANRLSRYWLYQGRPHRSEAQFEKHLEQMHAAEDVFWAGGDNDEINNRVAGSVKKIEEICERIIRPQPTLKGHLSEILNACSRYFGWSLHKK